MNTNNDVTVVVTDLDGTLLNSKKWISDTTRQAIKRLKEKGILFGLASGRSVESMMSLSKEWGIQDSLSFLAGMNGGAIYDVRQDIKKDYFMLDGKYGEEIVDLFSDMNVLFWVLEGRTRYTSCSTEQTRADGAKYNETEVEVDMHSFLKYRKINKMILKCDPKDMGEIIKRASNIHNPAYVGFSTACDLFEFVDPRINKGTGLEKICEHFGCQIEHVVAFGDERNDLEMLEKAGMGVCMKNGLDEVKAVSNYVSPYTNDEDAVAHYINEFIL